MCVCVRACMCVCIVYVCVKGGHMGVVSPTHITVYNTLFWRTLTFLGINPPETFHKTTFVRPGIIM